MAHAGLGVLKVSGLVKIGVFIVLSPVIGMVMGFIFMVATYWIFRKSTPQSVSGLFRRLQLLSSAAYSLGHGGNDAQKTMGIILAVLISGGFLTVDAEVPLWVVLSCHAAMGLGTLAGGWRIVKTMGQRICHLQPVHGFSAESAGALCLYGATWLGIPVSTTHIICTSIMGVGSTMGASTVKWGVARSIVMAWILTIPISALIGFVAFAVIRVFIGY